MRSSRIFFWLVFASLSAAFADDDDTSEDDTAPGLITKIQSAQQTRSNPFSRPAFWLQESESPAADVLPEKWSIVWQGCIETRVPGSYRFSSQVSGQFELTIDGQAVLSVDSSGSEEPILREGAAIELPAGRVLIKAEFTKISGRPAVLRFWRRLPDGFQESLLPSAFSHDVADDADEMPQYAVFTRGLELIAERRCTACHRGGDMFQRLSLPVRPAPPLAALVQGVKPDWLRDFLASPRWAKSHGTMPNLFGEGEAEDLDRIAVWRYLDSLNHQRGNSAADRNETERNDDPTNHLQPSTLDPQTFTAGKDQFARTGCIACHLFPGEAAYGEERLTSLDHVPKKFLPGQLRRRWFEEDVLVAKHEPRLDLRHFTGAEVNALEEFLLTPQETFRKPSKAAVPSVPEDEIVRDRFLSLVEDPEELTTFETETAEQRLVRLGRHVVQQRGCQACHRSSQDEPAAAQFLMWKAAVDRTRSAESFSGCLAEDPPVGVPDFELNPSEQKLIAHAFREMANVEQFSDVPLERLEMALRRLDCTACHERSGLPSAFRRRIGEFASLDRDQTWRDIVAPSLDGVGERLTPEWLRKVLIGHERVRPWLDLKMPRYDASEVEPLIELLIRADGLNPHEPGPPAPTADRTQFEGAQLLVGRTGLNCVGCHDFGDHRAVGVRAPDLSTAGQRLRYDWFRQWLHDPQAVAPGTRMPTIFHRGQSVLPQMLGGREEIQVNALWNYLRQKERLPPLLSSKAMANIGGESDTPIPLDGPLLLHGFMPHHAGLRGVAVGFPSGLHFAWDTEACRLTRVWQGPFVHQAGWDGSGKGGVEVNALSILGNILWSDVGVPAVRCAVGNDQTFPKESSLMRFEECWVTRKEAGFAWRVKTSAGEFQMKERLLPAPELSPEAFRRTISIEAMPAGVGLWQRVFGGLRKDAQMDLPHPAKSRWLRLPQGRYDWLLSLESDEEPIAWFLDEADDRQSGGGAPRKEIYLSVPSSERLRRVTLETIAVRVEQRIQPPEDWKRLIRRRGDSP